jgi:peptidoglycan L-alanyl-D-glutamate endopeptidase CwlK
MASRDLNDLDPNLQPLARLLVQKAAAAGIALTVICTLRTMEEQAALYAQGRTKPGPIVTYARPGYSYHNFGLAFDVVPTDLLSLRNWGETPEHRAEAKALWDELGSIGTDLGLTWGGDFPTLQDRPHFEWSDGLSLAQLRAGARPAASPTQKD